MNESTTQTDRRRIWKILAIAALLGLVALFAVVLPAERGYDPTGIGKLLGLTAMNEEPSLDTVIEDLLAGNENLTAAAGADPDAPLPLPNPAISQVEAAPARSETVTVRLEPDGRTEVKAVMKKAKAILYDWKVEDGDVYVDFHGHDPSKGKNYWVRYEEAGQEHGEGVSARSGSLVAPFDGEHGWYWLNLSDHPITIRLTVSGYYDKLVDYGVIR